MQFGAGIQEGIGHVDPCLHQCGCEAIIACLGSQQEQRLGTQDGAFIVLRGGIEMFGKDARFGLDQWRDLARRRCAQ